MMAVGSDRATQDAFDAEMRTEVIGLFREDGTGFVCVACGGTGEIVVEEGGRSGGGPYPDVYWASGNIVCEDCGASEFWSDST